MPGNGGSCKSRPGSAIKSGRFGKAGFCPLFCSGRGSARGGHGLERTFLAEKLLQEIRQIAGESGCELLAVETSGAGRSLTLRLVLDKEGGVSLEDCERVSRDVSPLLD